MTNNEEGRSAADRLKAIEQQITQERAEEAAKAEAAQTRESQRMELLEAAQRSLSPILETLRKRVAEAAPSAQTVVSDGLTIRLANGALIIHRVQKAPADCLAAFDYAPAFDVIAYTKIEAQKPRDHFGYEGRSHSLWYCDAQEEGEYRWYELAFMVQPLIPQRFTLDPFALPPTDEDAAGALTPVMTVRQIAWGPKPFDGDDAEEFTERWIGWLAEAAEGSLSHPRSMPEPEGKSGWRPAQRKAS